MEPLIEINLMEIDRCESKTNRLMEKIEILKLLMNLMPAKQQLNDFTIIFYSGRLFKYITYNKRIGAILQII